MKNISSVCVKKAPHDTQPVLIKAMNTELKVSPAMHPAWEEERERLHRQMLSSVSHDLKTPLASIIGSLEIYQRMKATLDPEKRNMLMETALQEAYRLDVFVTNILDMARLDEGRMVPQRTHIQLKHLIDDCIGKMASRLQEGSVSIQPSGDIDVWVDAGLISRAVQHLLDNAVKYCPPPVEIAIRYGRDNEMAFIAVSDNGLGIPPHREDEIFNKYTRLAKTDYQVAGTGLGLSICRAIARLHDGNITVANRPQGGAEFTLTFQG